MPKRNKSIAEGITIEHYAKEIVAQVEDLLGAHGESIMGELEEAEGDKIGVTFNAEIDASASKPVVETRIRFGIMKKDKRKRQLEDPAQGIFAAVESAGQKPVDSDEV